MTAPIVEAQDLHFAYPNTPSGRAGFAIRALEFAVVPGEILAVIGPNASGKTTLIRLLSKVLVPDRGRVRLEGREMATLSRAEVARRLAVVPQDVPVGFPYTVEELVLMGRFPHGPGRFFETRDDRLAAAEAMAIAGVSALAREALSRISGGERQRVILARALAQRPRLLLLDEPTTHLDLRYQAEVVGLLRRLNGDTGLTVILVSHDLNLAAEMSHRVLLLADGALVRIGPPEAVLEESLIQSVYGCRVVVDKHPTSHRPSIQVVWPGSERRSQEG
jgi:iron complex transport system ATP-binding protein